MQIAIEIINQCGYWGIFSLTALEQFILPVPGDIFLTVGIGKIAGFSFKNIMALIVIAVFIGSYAGYFLGKYFGHPIVLWLFGKSRIDKWEVFIKKYGVWGIIVAGLTPMVPFKIITWGSGIFEVPLKHFTIGLLFGRIPKYIIAGFAATLIYQTKFYATPEMSAIVLGIFQGVTEFLPVSSSGHLVIMEHFLKLPAYINASDLELFDIFLHGGSLLAIMVIFWRDWILVLKEFWGMVKNRVFDKNTLTAKLIIGTIPAVFAGLLFGKIVGGTLREFFYIAVFFIITAIFYLYAEWKGGKKNLEKVSLKQSLVIGIAQALALIPSVSRSGITIGVGMLFGLKREAAAKFSFMLGGIAILAANIYAIFSIKNGAVMPNLSFTLIGTITSFFVSLAVIIWLLKFLAKHTLRPFSFYLMVLGALILMIF